MKKFILILMISMNLLSFDKIDLFKKSSISTSQTRKKATDTFLNLIRKPANLYDDELHVANLVGNHIQFLFEFKDIEALNYFKNELLKIISPINEHFIMSYIYIIETKTKELQ